MPISSATILDHARSCTIQDGSTWRTGKTHWHYHLGLRFCTIKDVAARRARKERPQKSMQPPPPCVCHSAQFGNQWSKDLELGLTFDHVDIIGPISNGQGNDILVPLHHLDNESFLLRCHPATDHCFTGGGQLYKCFFHPVLLLGLLAAQAKPLPKAFLSL